MEHSVYPRCTQHATMEANTMQETALLELRGICKFFPGVRALDGVDFTLCKGEIHALMGENGAGKSTLIKVLTGVYSKDEGTISMEGTPVQIRSTQDALKAGISTVYQEITLCPNLTVAENLYIGRTKGAFTNWRKMNAGAKKLLSSLGIPAAPTQQLSSCSIAVQQMVAIARAVDMECKVLILDEPTSSLDEQEVEKLFKLMLDLKSRGVGIIFVTHFLEQVYAVCDRITVLRDGECVGTIGTKDCTEPQLVNMMVGRTLDDIYPKGNAQIGEAVLEAKHLNAGKMVQDVSFTLHRGEILGFAGLIGAGRSEVMRAIFGVDPLDSGEIVIDGKKLEKHTPTDAIRAGLGLVPEDRKLLGLILDMSVRENTTLPCLPVEMKGGILSRKKENEITQTYIEQLDIKTPGAEQKVLNLSGGNQQKVVIGKWLATHPKVLILDEPTRGIDVGAKREIHQLMSKLADQGVGIIMISSEMPEVLGMSDRIIVMHEGHVCGELSRSEATQERIMSLILSAAG